MPIEDNRFIFPMVPGPVPTRVQQPSSGQTTVMFVYKNGDNFVMTDDITYEQIEISKALVGSQSQYLKEGMDGITLTYLAGFILGIKIPEIVELEVTQVIPHGDASGGERTAVAVLESGAEVTVPFTIETGQIVRIDTRTGTFAGLAE
jgi:elongation factor P